MLENTAKRGKLNGLKGLKYLNNVELKEREPLYILTKDKYYVDSNGKFFPMKKIKKDLPKVLTELSKVNLKSLWKVFSNL